jgi:F0F1-type ATP synthase delta subunit
MKITPDEIARSLVDTVAESASVDVDDACLNAILLLKKRCPGVTPRMFVRMVEREVKRKGATTSGLLVVPNEQSLKAETIEPVLAKNTGKVVHIDRKTDPNLIGGAVLLIEHRRIDCSIQGALAALLRTCLQPLD